MASARSELSGVRTQNPNEPKTEDEISKPTLSQFIRSHTRKIQLARLN